MDYHVPSVALAMRILKLLSRYKYKRCTLRDITDLTGANKTTCLRVLRTLEREDFIKCDSETKKYSLGQYLIPLGNRAVELNDFVTNAATELKTVAKKTECTTILIERLQDDSLITIASEKPPKEEVSISVSIGQQFPIAGVSFGRCFLAYDDEKEWQRFIQSGLVRYTPNSTVDSDVFVKKLKGIKEKGYAASHGELKAGISAVAAPIFTKTGNVELVMSCLAMTSQFDFEKERLVVEQLVKSTRKLSEWSGYQGGKTHPTQMRPFEGVTRI